MSFKPGPRATQASSDNVVEFPARDKSTKQYTRRIFSWLDQICADPKLQPSDFKIAYVIAQHVNRKSGEAFVGIRTIATEGALSKPTVISGKTRLEQHGHLNIAGGRPGRGHSDHCRPVIKDDAEMVKPFDHLDDDKRSNLHAEKVKSATEKVKPFDQNYFITTSEPGAPSSRAPGLADREEEAFQELIELRPTHPNQLERARAAFGALSKTMRINDILDEAICIDGKPTDAVHFLNGLTTATVHASS
jgi:hypothetical protein